MELNPAGGKLKAAQNSSAKQTEKQAEKSASRALQILDCARLLAVISIVWLHTPESTLLEKSVDIGRFAVPFFTFAALFLAFQSSLRHVESSLGSYVSTRFRRIYLVFLFWSLVYGIVRTIRDFTLRHTLPSLSIRDFLWDGTAHHLWFLPFVFVASSLSFAVARWTEKLRSSYWPIAAFCAGLGLVFALQHAPNSFKILGYTSELSADVLPSVLLAIAFAMIYARAAPELFCRRIVTVAGVLLWLICLAILLTTGRTILLETLSGFGLFLASLNRSSTPLTARMAGWGKFAFGIYILHVLFLEGFQDIARKIGWPPSPENDVITFLVTLVACAISIFVLNRNAQARKLLL